MDKWAVSCKNIFGHMATAKAQINLGVRSLITVLTVCKQKHWIFKECFSGEQMPVWDCTHADWCQSAHFAHVGRHFFAWCGPSQGPVVQSIVSLTSWLRVISLTVLVDSLYNILIFFAEKMWVAFVLQKLLTFFQQKISAYLGITRCKF